MTILALFAQGSSITKSQLQMEDFQQEILFL